LSNGTVGQVLISKGGTNAPQWANAASSSAIDGITIQDEGSIVGSSGSISALNFVGNGVVATASGSISTITISQSVDGSGGIANTATNVIGGIASVTSLSVSGISTLGTIQISSGIVTATTGIVTYYGDGQYLQNIISGVGIQSSGTIIGTGFTTINFVGSQNSIVGNGTTITVTIDGVSQAGAAVTAFDVIGGIGSLTSLSVSGVSTLGTVKIDAGIITSTTGTAVTYFGNLTGTASTASFATTAFTLNNRVESEFNVATAVTATNLADAANITTGTISDDRLGGPYTIDIVGSASTASFATTSFSLNGVVESDLNVAFAQTAGIATETTRLQTTRTFEITGDIIASPISFNGTGNVSLAATIQPNSVALGNDTTGDYVESISGTGNQITVTAGTGEGSTPTISIPNNPTLPGTTVTVATDLQVNRNLNVDGNITIGGTSATLFTETLKISDPDIIVGFRTDAGGNDISNDTTANHGGIAVASTEGSPIVNFVGGGGTVPTTYKKIFWFKSGSFTGLATDAWLTNYAFGVGTTSMSAGTKFAVGNIETDFDDIKSVRNINASGIVTATGGFVGNLTGTASTASFATTAFTLNNRVESEFNVATAVTATNLANAANITTGTISDDRLGGPYTIDIVGSASTASFATTAFTLNNRVESDFNVAFATTAGIATYTSEWIIAANGTSDYRFTGPGFTGSENDPTIYLTRGEQYKFTNNLGAHPFQIQRQFQNTGGTAYNDGIVNNGVSNGTLTWNVRMDAPDILYYQCTSHTNMSGKIYIVNAGIASDVNLFTTGIVTATTFVGNLTGTASNASGATGDFSIADKIVHTGDTNTAIRFPAADTFTVETAGTERLRITSDGSVGIGSAVPQDELDVHGNIITGGLKLVNNDRGNPTRKIVIGSSSVYHIRLYDPTDTTRLQSVFKVDGTVGIGTDNPTSKLDVVGDAKVSGVVTATSFYGSAANLTATTGASAATYGNASNVAQVVVDANGRITGISNVAISGGTNGVTIENNGSPVGTAITTINFSSNVTATASGSIATITSSGGGGGDTYQFNTGVTSSISLAATGIGVTALTLPSTAGKQYTIYSINASNVATGNTEVNFIGAFDFSGGERSYFAYNIPVPTGFSIELLEEPQILNPSDKITIRSTDFVRNGADDIIDVYITYKEETSSEYFGVGIGSVGIAVTTNIGIYTSSTYPSVVQSIRLTNRKDDGGKPISIAINNGIRTTYLVDNLIVPKYGSIELLETPKRLNTNDIIEVQVDETECIDIQISGKKITS